MRAGKLRHRVVFDEPLLSQGPSGEELITWTTEGNGSIVLNATIQPMRGNEILVQNQQLPILDTKIIVRWSPNADRITPKWRGRFADAIYDIRSVAHIDLAQRMIQFICQSGQNSG